MTRRAAGSAVEVLRHAHEHDTTRSLEAAWKLDCGCARVVASLSQQAFVVAASMGGGGDGGKGRPRGGRGRSGGGGGGKGKKPDGEANVQVVESVPEPAAESRRDTSAQDDDYVQLGRKIQEMMKAEMSQRTALTRRVGDLEDTLASVRKELADLRTRNERLTQQLQAAEQAAQ